MRNPKLYLILAGIIFLFSGSYFAFATDGTIDEGVVRQITILNETQSYDDFKKDSYDLEDIKIEGDVLVLSVRYGACGEYEFKLMWDGTTMTTNPGGVTFSLYHDVKGLMCEANFKKILRFDLSEVGENAIIYFKDYDGKSHKVCYKVKEGYDSFCSDGAVKVNWFMKIINWFKGLFGF